MKELHVQKMTQTDENCSQTIYQDFETLQNDEAESLIMISALTDEVASLKKAECNCERQQTITQPNVAVFELQHKQMIAKATESETNLAEQIRAEHAETAQADSASVISENR